MAEPTTRAEFKQRCLRELGHPVIEINVADEQLDDQIDSALKYYYDYHFNGNQKTYYKHVITTTDIANKYITLPENIIGAVKIFPMGGTLSTSNIFSIKYQIALNDLYSLTANSMLPYFSALQHIGLIEELLVGQQPIRYNRHTNRLYVDMNWDVANAGNYLLVEAFEVIDPETYTDAWADRWLIEYCSALIKRQWGNNLKKFSGVMLPGNVQLNGQVIYDEAVQDINRLEEFMIHTYSIPAGMFVG